MLSLIAKSALGKNDTAAHNLGFQSIRRLKECFYFPLDVKLVHHKVTPPLNLPVLTHSYTLLCRTQEHRPWTELKPIIFKLLPSTLAIAHHLTLCTHCKRVILEKLSQFMMLRYSGIMIFFNPKLFKPLDYFKSNFCSFSKIVKINLTLIFHTSFCSPTWFLKSEFLNSHLLLV